MMLVHGTPDEVTRAKSILAAAGATKTELNLAQRPVAALA